MNKELEVLKDFEIYLSSYGLEISPLWLEIKQALTPPTSDEVCTALSNCLGFKVEYKWKTFYKLDSMGRRATISIASLKKVPHLITLIGRFCEGVNDNGSNK